MRGCRVLKEVRRIAPFHGIELADKMSIRRHLERYPISLPGDRHSAKDQSFPATEPDLKTNH